MKLRLAPGAALFVIWIGCGGAFTTSDQGAGGGGSGNVTGGSGSSGTSMGTGGIAGSEGTGGSSAGSSSVGGSGIGGSGIGGSGIGGSGIGGSSNTGGAAGRGGGLVDAGLDYTACDGPGQCVAVDTNCCGTCGIPQVTNMIGINTKYVQSYHQEKCPVALPCPACVSGRNPNIAARCDQGHCKAFDIKKEPSYTQCQAYTDCHLRSGLGCCVCGGPDAGWVALNGEGEQRITKDMCAPMTGCLACVPVPPPSTAAACLNNVCSVVMAVP